MTDCITLRNYLLRYLMEDIEAHEKGLYSEIGKAERNMPNWKNCEAEDKVEAHRLGIAHTFWDYWMDARNHDWGYYPGVEQKDWPIIARQICQGLVEQWEPDKMTNNFVFQPPPRLPKPSIRQRLKNLFQPK